MLPVAVLRGNKAILITGIDLIKQKRFGKYDESIRKLILSPLEVLYLAERGKISIKDRNKKEYSFEDLVKYFAKYDKNIFPKYLIYRDLTDRGYKVMDGYSSDIDLLVFDRGDYPEKPAKYRIIGIDEGKPIKIVKILSELRETLLSKKELKIALIERRGEVIYYTVSLLKGGKIDED